MTQTIDEEFARALGAEHANDSYCRLAADERAGHLADIRDLLDSRSGLRGIVASSSAAEVTRIGATIRDTDELWSAYRAAFEARYTELLAVDPGTTR